MTDSHIIFTSANGVQYPKYAKDLTLSDKLIAWNGKTMEETNIRSLEYVFSNGYAAPLTQDGTLLGKMSEL